MDRHSLTVAELNDLRTRAVQMRMRGEKLLAIVQATELSIPTIIAAHKAYQKGGWPAVALRPRGRSPGRRAGLDHGQHAELVNSLLDQLPSTHGLTEVLWDANALIDLLQQSFSVELDRSAARRLQREVLGLQFPDLARLARSSINPAWQSQNQADQTVPGTFWMAEQSLRELISGEANCLWPATACVMYAQDARGSSYWQVLSAPPRRMDYTEFFAQLARIPAIRRVFVCNTALHPKHLAVSDTPIQLLDCPLFLTPARKLTGGDIKPNGSTQALRTLNPKPNRNPIPGGIVNTKTTLTHLQRLEAESIHIMREVVAEAENPVMLYSIGKDSAVMLHLARKAFFPAVPPFPLLHVDTTWKFKAMYEFRERMVNETGMKLLRHVNEEGVKMGVNPFTHGSAIHTDIMKTQGLKQALDKYRFDAAFGGARRDEEKSRAKERVFSFRSAEHRWDPKNQRPELWRLYNARKHRGESFRVFPISNWTELDIWQYIFLENIPIVPLYFAAPRPVVERDGTLIMVDDERMPLKPGEVPMMRTVRFRTLGCYPLTGAVESQADTLTAIIQEMLMTTTSERQGRMIDHDQAASMERKKQEGYF
jgi:sulfate adenylyltransferase subunit 2